MTGDLEEEPPCIRGIQAEREKSRAVMACAAAQFFGTMQIQPLVAHKFSDVTPADNLSGRGGGHQ